MKTFQVFTAQKKGEIIKVFAPYHASVHKVIEMVNQYRKDGWQVFNINYSPIYK